jgi:putative DNA methylase
MRLLTPDELPAEWAPPTYPSLTAWRVVHHLIRVLSVGREDARVTLVNWLCATAGVALELAYRPHALCEPRKAAIEGLADAGLVRSFPEIPSLAREGRNAKPDQDALIDTASETVS